MSFTKYLKANKLVSVTILLCLSKFEYYISLYIMIKFDSQTLINKIKLIKYSLKIQGI